MAGYGATNVTVQFAPLAAGGFTNRVIFTSDGGVSTNTVTGTGAVVPAALFTGTPTNGIVPLTVTFTDNSTGTITNRAWSFGDGATTNTLATSVQHVYTSAGTNTVRLIVSGPVGVSTNTQANLIVVVNPPQLLVNPGSLNFGALTVGQTNSQNFFVINTGGSLLSGTATGTAPFAATAGSSYSVAPGGTQTVTVAFAPSAAGTFNSIVLFASDGGTSIIPVSGVGADPGQIVVNPPSLDFGILATGTTAQLVFTISNSGVTAVTNGTASVSGGPYTLLPGTTFTVPAGSTTNVTVQFAPATAGEFTNQVIFETANGGNSTNTVTGTGAIAPDVTPPQLQVAAPADYQAFTNAAITVAGTASDVSGINNVTVNGASASLIGTNWSWLFPLSIGTNVITVIATDDSPAMNTTTQLIHAVRLPILPPADTNPPTITITFPTNGWTTASNSVDVIGLVFDDTAVASVLATNEGVSSVNAVFGGGNWQANLMPLKLGTNVLHATATDTSTNSASATVTIIRVSPHYVNTTLRVAKATFSFGTTTDTDSFKISGVFNDTGLAANFTQNEIGVMVGCFEQFLPPNSLVNLKFASPVSGSNNLTLLSVNLTKRTFRLAGAGLTLTNDNPFIVGIAPGPLDLGPDYISPLLPVGGAGKAIWKYGIQLPVVDQFFLGKSSLATNSFKLTGTINVLGKPNLLTNVVTFGIGSFEDVLPANGWIRGVGNIYTYVRPAGHVGGVATMLLDLDKGKWKATGKGVDLRFLTTSAPTSIRMEFGDFAPEYTAQLRIKGTKFTY